MSTFRGFSEGKTSLTPLPGPFFSELLPLIDDLGELKVTIYAFWRLDHMEGSFRYLQQGDFLEDQAFMQGMGPTSAEAQQALEDALRRAVSRGTFLPVSLNLGSGLETFYFLNSPKGRAAVKSIQDGKWRPSGNNQLPVEMIVDGPNIYRLYEENIGPLTPMIAESLGEAENEFPASWIEEAFRIAVENNKRSWRYIAAILKRWQQEGRNERQDRRDSEKDRRRYVEGEFSDFIEH